MERPAGITRDGLAAGFLAALVVALVWWATPALASDALPAGTEPELVAAASDDTAQRSEEFERWRGRSCPIGGCRPAPRSQATTPLAFGAAVGTIAWLSRRRASRLS